MVGAAAAVLRQLSAHHRDGRRYTDRTCTFPSPSADKECTRLSTVQTSSTQHAAWAVVLMVMVVLVVVVVMVAHHLSLSWVQKYPELLGKPARNLSVHWFPGRWEWEVLLPSVADIRYLLLSPSPSLYPSALGSSSSLSPR